MTQRGDRSPGVNLAYGPHAQAFLDGAELFDQGAQPDVVASLFEEGTDEYDAAHAGWCAQQVIREMSQGETR